MFKTKIFLLLVLSSLLSASTMYTLSGVKKLYTVVELSGKSIPKEIKSTIQEELQSLCDDLNIDTTGYNQRSLALLVTQRDVAGEVLINIDLIIGEEVKRIDTNEKTFALTYLDTKRFILGEDDEFEDKFEDELSLLLTNFAEQYKEENKALVKVKIDQHNFAKEMHYENNYNKALEKAKKSKKNIMLVLVSNYCPWCRKFEQRVLLNKETNALIQKNYIPLIINKEKGGFPKELNKGFTPIVHFIDYKTNKSYKTIFGYNNKDEFLYFVKNNK